MFTFTHIIINFLLVLSTLFIFSSIVAGLLKKFVKPLANHSQLINFLSSLLTVVILNLIYILYLLYLPTPLSNLVDSLSILTFLIPFFLFLLAFGLNKLVDRATFLKRSKVVLFSVATLIFLGFFYPRPSGYTHHGDPYYWQIKTCDCIGFKISTPGLDTTWWHCLGIPHSCKERTEQKEGVKVLDTLDTTEENFKLIYKLTPELKYYSETEHSVDIDRSVLFDIDNDGLDELVIPSYLECKVKIFSLTGTKIKDLSVTEGIKKERFATVPTGPSCRTDKVYVGNIYGDGNQKIVTGGVEFAEHIEEPGVIRTIDYETVYVFSLPEGKVEKIIKFQQGMGWGDVLYSGDIDKDKKIDMTKYLSRTRELTFFEEENGVFQKVDSKELTTLPSDYLDFEFYDQESDKRSLTLASGRKSEEQHITLALENDKIVETSPSQLAQQKLNEYYSDPFYEKLFGKELIEVNKKIKIENRDYPLIFRYRLKGGLGGLEDPYSYQLVLLIEDSQSKKLAKLTKEKVDPKIQIKDVDNDGIEEIVWIENSRTIFIYKPIL